VFSRKLYIYFIYTHCKKSQRQVVSRGVKNFSQIEKKLLHVNDANGKTFHIGKNEMILAV